MHLRDQVITLYPDEFLIIPHGVEHCPVANDEEAEVLLFEPAGTVNTGNLEQNERTRTQLEKL